MWLSYFTENAYDKLFESIKDNLTNYLNDEDWLPGFFHDLSPYFKESKAVDVGDFIPSYEPNGASKSDAQKADEDLVNIRLLYDSFKSLTPLQASNKYMWTYLCHANPRYRAYIKDRFFSKSEANEDFIKTVKTRVFVYQNSNLRNDNALSRLWWYGYLTYDKSNKSDPYALTKILLTNQTIATDVFDTPNRSNPNRIKGVLWGIRDYIEEIGTSKGVADDFRKCKKYLNHYGAVTDLSFLTPEEMRDLTYNYLLKTHK